ncbi:hypothetical protein [Anaeromyxobacter paludicola]|uniref:hypothetical protein n=1 Tax=Anaeromyxobacter paludicola TaxID=2918171 RepID=UPI0020BDFB1F|nr:hypothetical protein [Anaeromyxobacter paludicola]
MPAKASVPESGRVCLGCAWGATGQLSGRFENNQVRVDRSPGIARLQVQVVGLGHRMSECPSTFRIVWMGTHALASKVPAMCLSLWMVMPRGIGVTHSLKLHFGQRVTAFPPPVEVVRRDGGRSDPRPDGWAFRAEFPRSAVAAVEAYDRRPVSRGVHGLAGRWIVNGSGRGIVTIALEPKQRAYGMGCPVRLRDLLVSVDDPEGLMSSLLKTIDARKPVALAGEAPAEE